MVLTKSESQAGEAAEDLARGQRTLSDLASRGVNGNAAALDAIRAAADAVLPITGVVVTAAQNLKAAELRLSAVDAGDGSSARADVARATFQAAVAARTHADAEFLSATEQLQQLSEAESLVEAARIHQATAEQAAASAKHSYEAAVTMARLLREIIVVVDDELALTALRSELVQQRSNVAKAHSQALLATNQASEAGALSDAAALDAKAANTDRLLAQQQAAEGEAARLAQELDADTQRLAEAEARRLEDSAQQEAEKALAVATAAFEEVDLVETDRLVAEEAALLAERQAEEAIQLIDDLIDDIEDDASESGLANAG